MTIKPPPPEDWTGVLHGGLRKRRDPPPPDTGGVTRDGFKIHSEGWALLIVFCAVVAFVIYLFVGAPR